METSCHFFIVDFSFKKELLSKKGGKADCGPVTVHFRRVSNLLKIILIYEEQYINIKDKMWLGDW